MHIYFAGIGGAGIGPLALIAQQAGYQVSGSDKQDSSYLTYLKAHGIANIHIGQTEANIAAVNAKNPIDWYVYSSALPMEDPHHPELRYCKSQSIKATKRDEFLTKFLEDTGLQMIAVAGTHGKTTTTALTVWLLQQLGLPISYLLPAKTSYASLGAYDAAAQYFVYECDEFDRNFLAFHPRLSLITGIDWDHPDIYPTRDSYNNAFQQFVDQSEQTYIWNNDATTAGILAEPSVQVMNFDDADQRVTLPGTVNRQNALLVAAGISRLLERNENELITILNAFPGVARRFEQITPSLYSDYAHTPPKIRGALQLGHEVAGENLVVVYEGLHNTRQHFIKDELRTLFDDVKSLYIVPSYLAREDTNLALLSPADLKALLSESAQQHTSAMQLDEALKDAIDQHLAHGDTVLCLTAGGGNSLDEWLRKEFVH